MEVRISFNNKVSYSFCFGHGGKDKSFDQIYWFSITKEFVKEGKVWNAKMIFSI